MTQEELQFATKCLSDSTETTTADIHTGEEIELQVIQKDAADILDGVDLEEFFAGDHEEG